MSHATHARAQFTPPAGRTVPASATPTCTQRSTTNRGWRSLLFAATLGVRVKHKSRPCRPQTNGKIERVDRTLAAEWAYAEHCNSDAARAATYPAWVHHYDHHRRHTGIGGKLPIERIYNIRQNCT